MRSTNFSIVALLSGLAAATLPGYVDKCSDGSTCCTNPARLFRRTLPTTCTPDKVCCEEKKVAEFSGSAVLGCGKDNVKTSEVKADVIPCKSDPTQDCLHVAYHEFEDKTPYTEYHLQLSQSPIETSNPGGYKFSDTCAFGEGNLTIDCYIPLTRIASEVYGDASFNFCGNDKLLYIAAHAVEGSETCWAGDKLINTKGNWAKYFSGTWLPCKTICKTECTCPCEPVTKYCEQGTGFTFNDECSEDTDKCDYQIEDLGCSARWGWFHEIPKTDKSYEFELLEGAGDNLYSKGTSVGTVLVTVSGGKVDVKYQMKTPYAINKAHIDLTCFKPVTTDISSTGLKPSQTGYPCAPGKYTYQSACLDNAPAFSTSLTVPTTGCAGDKLYLIFHAEVTVSKPLTDTCTPVGC